MATTPTPNPQFIWLIAAVLRDCQTITATSGHKAVSNLIPHADSIDADQKSTLHYWLDTVMMIVDATRIDAAVTARACITAFHRHTSPVPAKKS